MNGRPHPKLADIVRAYVLKTLRRCHGNRTHAARQLGISVRSLRDRLHRYEEAGFEFPEPYAGIARPVQAAPEPISALAIREKRPRRLAGASL